MSGEGQQRCHGGCNTGRAPTNWEARAWDAVARPQTQCETSHHRPAGQKGDPRRLFEEWEYIDSHIEAMKLVDDGLVPVMLVLDSERRSLYREIATDWERSNSRILNVVSTVAHEPPATPVINEGEAVIAYGRFRKHQGVFWLFTFDINGEQISAETIGELGLEDSIGNELIALLATMGVGAIVGVGRSAISAAARGALSMLTQAFTRITSRLMAWRLARVALVRLGKTSGNLLNQQVIRSAGTLTRPTVFRHTISHPIHEGITYAQIEQDGFLFTSAGGTAHYGEGVYAWRAGTTGVKKFIDIEVQPGVAVEQLIVKNSVSGRTQTFVRLLPASGENVPIKIVGTNLTKEEIAFGRNLVKKK